jgi:hypothetical protein
VREAERRGEGADVGVFAADVDEVKAAATFIFRSRVNRFSFSRRYLFLTLSRLHFDSRREKMMYQGIRNEMPGIRRASRMKTASLFCAKREME